MSVGKLIKLKRPKPVKPVLEIGGASLPGAPNLPNIPGRGVVRVGRNEDLLSWAQEYATSAKARKRGVEYDPVNEYAPLDEDRARAIAAEYDLMKHAPKDKDVKRSYKALASETLDQYEGILSRGYKPYWIDGPDPYANSHYEALIDLEQNKRLGIFPTRSGFGSDAAFDASDNPLLAESGLMLEGKPVLLNDAFRFVHDAGGHAKQGAGFRAMGEENAYLSHAGMFSPLARRALATETRGQNSWLNYGPFGESNRSAGILDTVFADQKTGNMPLWTVEGGRSGARRERFQSNLRSGKTGLEGAIDDGGRLSLTHYSRRPLERIDPQFQLTGLSGQTISERNRLAGSSVAPKRSYYGIQGKGVEHPYRKEDGLGDYKHRAFLDPELIYDVSKDPDKLWQRGYPSESEAAIKAKNYSGYYFDHPELGKVAVVYDALTAQRLKESGYANPILLAGTAATLGGVALAASQDAEAGVGRSTIMGAQRKMFPGIYRTPEQILSDVKVAPEDPMMGRLFGVTREDLAKTAERQGNTPGTIPGAPKKPSGSAAAEPVMKPANTGRLVDLLQASRDTDLGVGMRGWYVMDPMYQRLVELVGPEEATKRYGQLNHLTGMASPASNVLREINRGTAANMLQEKGRFGDFLKYGGGTEPGRPDDMAGVLGHAYHRTAQSPAMRDYLATGSGQMKSPKVPLYIQASGVPETGFQTDFPVGDAHWSRGVGLADTRTSAKPAGSYTTPEAMAMQSWWKDDVAAQAGMESVPAQATLWGALSHQTGVDTPVGAPKLELWSGQIAKAAERLGISPEDARDRIFLGKEHAGFADPRLLGATAAVTGAGLLAAQDSEAAFAGPKARLFPHDMHGMAIKMKEAGVSRDDIWQKTGIDLDNPDGVPRTELDDSMMSMDIGPYGGPVGKTFGETFDDRTGGRSAVPYNQTFNNPNVEANYDMGPVGVLGFRDPGRGSYSPIQDRISLNRDLETSQAVSTGAHETMHSIQHREGMATGGDPQKIYDGLRAKQVMFESDILNARFDLAGIARAKDQAKEAGDYAKVAELDQSYNQALIRRDGLVSDMRSAGLDDEFGMLDKANAEYKNLAGEAEARNVQGRLGMTPQERRILPPWTTVDVPESEQIVRRRENTSDSEQSVDELNEQYRLALAAQKKPPVHGMSAAFPALWLGDTALGLAADTGQFLKAGTESLANAVLGIDARAPMVSAMENPWYKTSTPGALAMEEAFGKGADMALDYRPAPSPWSPDPMSLREGAGRLGDLYTDKLHPWMLEKWGPYGANLAEGAAFFGLGASSLYGTGLGRLARTK